MRMATARAPAAGSAGTDDLGVHEETNCRWAREGVIPAAKLGNRGGFRFGGEDLDRFLEGRRSDQPGADGDVRSHDV